MGKGQVARYALRAIGGVGHDPYHQGGAEDGENVPGVHCTSDDLLAKGIDGSSRHDSARPRHGGRWATHGMHDREPAGLDAELAQERRVPPATVA